MKNSKSKKKEKEKNQSKENESLLPPSPPPPPSPEQTLVLSQLKPKINKARRRLKKNVILDEEDYEFQPIIPISGGEKKKGNQKKKADEDNLRNEEHVGGPSIGEKRKMPTKQKTKEAPKKRKKEEKTVRALVPLAAEEKHEHEQEHDQEEYRRNRPMRKVRPPRNFWDNENTLFRVNKINHTLSPIGYYAARRHSSIKKNLLPKP
eukprot:TRINITY_DN6106_c0_g1_i1.p1 TRINITY_DN6106_c0_g1~~TRINITY_DN6106_c0_g1_i1.p1  ORF type:complete len:242 (+),score=80.78 TRINITY_DN6106_c0_g1_i1:111-728(+)